MREKVLSLKRPEPASKTVDLVSSFNPDAGLQISVKRLTLSELYASRQKAFGYVLKYITGAPLKEDGTPDSQNPAFVPPTPLPPIDGQVVTVTEAALDVLAQIEVAQVGEDPYSIEELLVLATDNDFWVQLVKLQQEFVQPPMVKEPPQGNFSAP
jgi:hypothetical protein